MKHIAWLSLLAACGSTSPPPAATGPTVSSLSPATGLWGTEVTITGADLGASATGNAVSFAGSAGASGFVVDTWHETEIRGRVAFPATGAMTIETAAGSAPVGTFLAQAPWAPSAAFDVTQLAEARVLSTDHVAALYGQFELAAQPTLVVFDGSDAGAYALVDPQSPGAVTAAHLAEGDGGGAVVIATAADGAVVAIAASAGSATVTPTGLMGTVVAAARDATGLYAWVATSGGLVRARPGTPWSVERGPIATALPPLAAAVAADGTLWLAVAEPATGTMVVPAIQVLGPSATQLAPAEAAALTPVPGPLVDVQLRVASDGVHALLTAAALAAPRIRTGVQMWTDAPSVTGLVQLGFIGATLAALATDPQSSETTLLPDLSVPGTALAIPVWPMRGQGFAVDGAGSAHPLITNGAVTYALAPP